MDELRDSQQSVHSREHILDVLFPSQLMLDAAIVIRFFDD